MDEKLSRRDLLQKSAAFGVLALAGAGVAACSKDAARGPSCNDTTGLSASDTMVRQSLGYIDVSTEPGKTCVGCQQYLPTTPSTCGTCKVLRGPISPNGYCKSFVAKMT
jgi:hypothetical protein